MAWKCLRLLQLEKFWKVVGLLVWALMQQYPQRLELAPELAFLLRLGKRDFVVCSHQVQLARAFVGFVVGIADLVVESHNLEEGGIGQGVVEIHAQVGDTNLVDRQMATFLETLDQGDHLYPILQVEGGKIQEVDIVQKEPFLEVVLVVGNHFVLEVELLVGFDFEGLEVLVQRGLDAFRSIIADLISKSTVNI